MASRYKLGVNPIEDFLFQTLVAGYDISDENIADKIYSGIAYIISNIIDEPEKNLQFLDINIINKDGYYKIVGNNFLSAMWLSRFFPDNIKLLLSENQIEDDEFIYKFNNKTKKLTIKEIKNGK